MSGSTPAIRPTALAGRRCCEPAVPGHRRGTGRSPARIVLNQLFVNRYPTWMVGSACRIHSGTDQQRQLCAHPPRADAGEQRVKGAQSRAIQQVRDAALEDRDERETHRNDAGARDLAERRLDAERKRYEVGMSTNFLVIQAQRDLAQARTNELAAVLAYDLSLVDFESLQQAGPVADGQAQASREPHSPRCSRVRSASRGTRHGAATTGLAVPGLGP